MSELTRENTVDKRHPITVAKQSRTFLDDVLFLKLQRLLHILTKLEKMTSRCITMLDLQNSGLSGQDAERFTVVLIQLNISIQTMLEDSKRR